MTDPDLPFYELIGQAIRASGKSLEEIAAALKRRGYPVNKGTLSRWTSGTQPRLDHLGALRCLPEVLELPLNQQAAFRRALNQWLGVTAGWRGSAPLPYRKNTLGSLPPFTGRTAELQRLHFLIDQHRSIAVTGLGGIGKTALARQLLQAGADRFTSGCEALVLHPRQTASQVIVQVARRLGMNLSDEVQDAESVEMLEWLSSYAAGVDLLFLLDDVVDEAQVSALTQRLSRITWVLTSRRPLRLPNVTLLALEAPADDEAARLLLGHADLPISASNLLLAQQIAARLGNLPLALSCAAGLTTMFNSDLEAVLNWLNAGELSALRLDYAHLPRFFARMLEDQPAEARALFELCGAFALPRISSALFQTMADQLELRLTGLRHLSDISLITWPETKDQFALHPLVHEYATQRLRGAPHHREIQRCFSACYAEFALAQRKNHEYHALQDELENVLAAADYAYQARDWECLLQFWSPVSKQLWLNGDKQRYAALDKQFLEAARARQDHNTEAQILSELGWVHVEMGELQEADRVLQESLALCATLPDGAFQRARVLRYQAKVAIKRGETQQALAHLREAEEILIHLGPAEGQAALALTLVYSLMAHIAYLDGNRERARSDAVISLRFCQQAGAEGQTYLPGVYIDLGDILHGYGETEMAEQQWQAAAGFGPQLSEDEGVATAYARLAGLAAQRGRKDEAQRLAQHAYQLYAWRGLARYCVYLDEWIKRLNEGGETSSIFGLARFDG